MTPDHELIRDLATDEHARVMVFIDGQNLYQTCRKLFGHPLCHPHLLAQHLAGPRTATPPSCRFYTGRPNQNVPGLGTIFGIWTVGSLVFDAWGSR